MRGAGRCSPTSTTETNILNTLAVSIKATGSSLVISAQGNIGLDGNAT